MKERILVDISRKWHKPQIVTRVTSEEIGFTMGLDDFLKALQQEIGSVRWTFRDATWQKQYGEAIERIIHGIKLEAVKVVR